MKNTKKKKVSHLYTKQLFGCLFEKTKVSGGLLLFLDLFWKRGKDKPSSFFFVCWHCFAVQTRKKKFFLKLFFVLFKVISKSKTFESQTCKKKAFFSCPRTNWCTNDTCVYHFSFYLKVWFGCNKEKKPIFLLFLVMPSEQHSPPKR